MLRNEKKQFLRIMKVLLLGALTDQATTAGSYTNSLTNKDPIYMETEVEKILFNSYFGYTKSYFQVQPWWLGL